jgi:hypothetical protein
LAAKLQRFLIYDVLNIEEKRRNSAVKKQANKEGGKGKKRGVVW